MSRHRVDAHTAQSVQPQGLTSRRKAAEKTYQCSIPHLTRHFWDPHLTDHFGDNPLIWSFWVSPTKMVILRIPFPNFDALAFCILALLIRHWYQLRIGDLIDLDRQINLNRDRIDFNQLFCSKFEAGF